MRIKTIIKTLLSASIAAGFIGNASAATIIGAGTGILLLQGANVAVDTPSDGTSDQSRQNLDDTFTATLAAGVYSINSFSYQAGQTGSVIPYLAKLTAANTYEILGVGDQIDVTTLNADVTVPFGGSNQFTLTGSTVVYAGIVNPTGPGSQNPIKLNYASGSTVDHDNNADGLISQAVVGGSVGGFAHANLGRSYAFSIEVDAIPEPSSAILSLLGVAVIGLRRRR
ncbi:MAG: PEP-CTERM sorting domain-containing protein [Verrucomicrobia bacterium]|nr:PEP-CTERM sorting domain-containing protein [Verrucomicrobiota bacterium]